MIPNCFPNFFTGGIDSESYFGYSVAQHRTLRSTDYGEPLILVGAPRDQNLQPGTTRSGALWQCKLTTDPKVRQLLILFCFERKVFCHYHQNKSTLVLSSQSEHQDLQYTLLVSCLFLLCLIFFFLNALAK